MIKNKSLYALYTEVSFNSCSWTQIHHMKNTKKHAKATKTRNLQAYKYLNPKKTFCGINPTFFTYWKVIFI